MGKNVTIEGRKWEVLFRSYLSDHPGFRKSLMNSNISMDDLINIDSKDKNNPFVKIKKELKALFLDNNSVMPGLNYSTSLRGDILCESLNIILDIKNYATAQGVMKLPKFLKKEDYIKGVDSNLKPFLFYSLDLFDFVDKHEDLKILKNFYMGTMEDTQSWWRDYDWYNTFCQKYSKETTVAYLPLKNFIEVFCTMECGYAWKIKGVEPVKGFLSKVENNVEFKISEFQNDVKSPDIEVKLYTDIDKYVFMNFYDGDTCIYSISQRGNGGLKKFGSNCSFINKNYMRTISNVPIPIIK